MAENLRKGGAETMTFLLHQGFPLHPGTDQLLETFILLHLALYLKIRMSSLAAHHKLLPSFSVGVTQENASRPKMSEIMAQNVNSVTGVTLKELKPAPWILVQTAPYLLTTLPIPFEGSHD